MKTCRAMIADCNPLATWQHRKPRFRRDLTSSTLTGKIERVMFPLRTPARFGRAPLFVITLLALPALMVWAAPLRTRAQSLVRELETPEKVSVVIANRNGRVSVETANAVTSLGVGVRPAARALPRRRTLRRAPPRCCSSTGHRFPDSRPAGARAGCSCSTWRPQTIPCSPPARPPRAEPTARARSCMPRPWPAG